MNDQTETDMKLPEYICHKKVQALKISEIHIKMHRDADTGELTNQETDGSAMIVPAERGFAPFRVDKDYLWKHTPEVGGYYVVYKDGYKSYSPAEAFEEGYDRVAK